MNSAASAVPSMDGSANEELHPEYRAFLETEAQQAVPSLFDFLDLEQAA